MELQEIITEPTDSSLVLAAQEGDREAFGQLARAVRTGRLRDRAAAAEQPRRGTGSLPGGPGAGHAEDLAIARAGRVRIVVAGGHQPHGDQPGRAQADGDCDRTRHAGRDLRRSARLRSRPPWLENGSRRSEPDSAAWASWIASTLVAFYVHGQSLVEMSEEFRSPVGTIKRRLHVARKRLAKELEELVAV